MRVAGKKVGDAVAGRGRVEDRILGPIRPAKARWLRGVTPHPGEQPQISMPPKRGENRLTPSSVPTIEAHAP